MADLQYIVLSGRGVLAVGGEDARGFLQDIISNDIDQVGPERAIYAALLTPQGKFLHDFFIVQAEDLLLFDCEGDRIDDLINRLSLYRLRAKVTFADVTDEHLVAALVGVGAADKLELAEAPGSASAFARGVAFVDPRLAAMGARAIVPRDGGGAAFERLGFAAGAIEGYERLRLGHGIPDGSRDMTVERALVLESGLERLNGVDFEKGCYVGQELTSRTKHRAVIRKRLFRVAVNGPLPAPGTPVMLGEHNAGEMRSGLDAVGLALLRLKDVEKAKASGVSLIAGEAQLTPIEPDGAKA